MLTGAFDVAKGAATRPFYQQTLDGVFAAIRRDDKNPWLRPQARKPFNFRSKIGEPLRGMKLRGMKRGEAPHFPTQN